MRIIFAAAAAFLISCSARSSDPYDLESLDARLKEANGADRARAIELRDRAGKTFESKQADGIALFKESARMYPDPFTFFALGNALSHEKQNKEAIRAYLAAERLDPENRGRIEYNIACAAARDGDREVALKYLAMALENGYSNMTQIKRDSDLDSIRSLPRYAEILSAHNAR